MIPNLSFINQIMMLYT